MSFNLQPVLEDKKVLIRPLIKSDFDNLYSLASDPLIWEIHPSKDRYKLDVFTQFFNEAILSNGSFTIYDKNTNKMIGTSRYYDLENDSVVIGYTFITREYWGSEYNKHIKTLMLNHAFKFIDKVIFHIGADNIRSQKAVLKLGAFKSKNMIKNNQPYHEYILYKNDWLKFDD